MWFMWGIQSLHNMLTQHIQEIFTSVTTPLFPVFGYSLGTKLTFGGNFFCLTSKPSDKRFQPCSCEKMNREGSIWNIKVSFYSDIFHSSPPAFMSLHNVEVGMHGSWLQGFLNLLVLPVNCQGRLHISQDHGNQLPALPSYLPSPLVHLPCSAAASPWCSSPSQLVFNT